MQNASLLIGLDFSQVTLEFTGVAHHHHLVYAFGQEPQRHFNNPRLGFHIIQGRAFATGKHLVTGLTLYPCLCRVWYACAGRIAHPFVNERQLLPVQTRWLPS